MTIRANRFMEYPLLFFGFLGRAIIDFGPARPQFCETAVVLLDKDPVRLATRSNQLGEVLRGLSVGKSLFACITLQPHVPSSIVLVEDPEHGGPGGRNRTERLLHLGDFVVPLLCYVVVKHASTPVSPSTRWAQSAKRSMRKAPVFHQGSIKETPLYMASL